jgi:DNA-binding MarR family transcriptional regulator
MAIFRSRKNDTGDLQSYAGLGNLPVFTISTNGETEIRQMVQEILGFFILDGPRIDEYVDINYSRIVSSPPVLPYETTLLVRDCCLCLHVQRAARALARRFDEALRPFELTNGQFSLLMSLNRPEPPSMRPVASLLSMDRTTLTAALKPLEQRGLVKISPDPADGRSRILFLTAKGRNLLAQALPVWQETHEEMEKLMPDGEADRLRTSLRAIA